MGVYLATVPSTVMPVRNGMLPRRSSASALRGPPAAEAASPPPARRRPPPACCGAALGAMVLIATAVVGVKAIGPAATPLFFRSQAMIGTTVSLLREPGLSPGIVSLTRANRSCVERLAHTFRNPAPFSGGASPLSWHLAQFCA